MNNSYLKEEVERQKKEGKVSVVRIIQAMNNDHVQNSINKSLELYEKYIEERENESHS